MPYFQVDLDAPRRAEAAAGLLGMDSDKLLGCLNKLWLCCYSEKRDTFSQLELAGFLRSRDAAVTEALVAFGFLELQGDRVRVRGTKRYERVREARSAGGKAAAGNLRQNSGSTPAAAGMQPDNSPADAPAATGSRSEIRDLRSEEQSQKHLSAAADIRSPPVSSLRTLWNQIAVPAGLSSWDEDAEHRNVHARARLKEKPDPEYWRRVIERIAASSFCRGAGKDHWCASADFLVQRGAAVKVLEGKYDDRESPKPKVDVRRGLQRSEDQGWESQPFVDPAKLAAELGLK